MKIKIGRNWYEITRTDIGNHCYWYEIDGNAYSVSFFNAVTA